MVVKPEAVLGYGSSRSQFVELWPVPPRSRGLAVLLHGGFWRARHGLDQMDPLCADLAERGWSVANVEYRRTDGDAGGWPGTLTDVLEAIDSVRQHRDPGGPVVAIGHSAGGHLALLAAASAAVDLTVALAPVTDLPRSAEEGLGEGAAPLFMGTTPEADPGSYRAASPRFRLPLGKPHLVVHGDADERVPVDHSRDYVAAARHAGDAVDYLELPDVGHFDLIDPSHHSWIEARSWLANAVC